ncbi:PTS sugar transporter subunit IIB [Atlantibacter subterraneus]|jgi:cellobiose PTS system EIIB component|uniref:PTS sugar transporter subunit IIB n=1 Tax=Atlantibacter subterraneus TaxID=255519 RepID=A0A427V580_9ENTR|nr:PTS sugar transporter subunit IIB [Atlantibacter subterranea]MDZ5665401.1 PTS sugar transporter subunit IIB [Atlantibacter hermannii]MDA3134535.1 PTS sugar transporter subunit IIB [Atlantibacter subterranea]MDV7022254.1 PTS sugar transporter subunit IIB [Atlantibacter subterranea]RSB63702.1 PTS sugar transporter subunit IIB [Atlantibacter subterranea]RSE06613.1 PTS sugar transporter subunit IIB [Atlantibacter subterranea]
MINIMLVCNAGMSTSMLMNKMIEAAKQQGIEAAIWAIPDAKLNEEWKKADVILLGPQVSYLQARVDTITGGSVPVKPIPMLDYGRMNGPGVLAMAMEMKK